MLDDFDPIAWAEQHGIGERMLRRRLLRARRGALKLGLGLLIRRSSLSSAKADFGEPRSWTWDILPYREDAWARRFVEEHPEGATLDEVGRAIGLTKERVRQIEETALAKLGCLKFAKDNREAM